jgi:hypothetical protein
MRQIDKIGHFVKVCNSKESEKPPQTGCITLESNSPARVAGIEESDFVKAGIHPNGSKKEIIIAILPDTGAQIDAIPADMYHNNIQDTSLLPRGTNAITATGSPIISIGKFEATIPWPTDKKSKSIKTTFHIVQDLKQPVGLLPVDYKTGNTRVFSGFSKKTGRVT